MATGSSRTLGLGATVSPSAASFARSATTASNMAAGGGGSKRSVFVGDVLKRRLTDLRLRGQNHFCADCEAAEPMWCAVELGALLCQECANVHRELVTCPNVYSLTIDKWTEEQVKELEEKGNAVVNAELEASIPRSRRKPTSSSSRQLRKSWIQDKYVKKAFTASSRASLLRRSSSARATAALASMQDRYNVLTEEMPIRLVDYFLVMGRGAPSKRRIGHVLTDSVLDVVWEPAMLEHYPREEHRDAPISDSSVAMFAFPDDVVLSEEQHRPTCHPFVLTKLNGARQYGVCLVFWEQMDALDVVKLQGELQRQEQERKKQQHNGIAEEEEESKGSGGTGMSQSESNGSLVFSRAIFSPKCICVLSHWPFYSGYECFLKTLYRISLSAPPLPLERFVSNFCNAVPVPPAGEKEVKCSIGDQVIPFSRPPPNRLPLHDLGFERLFQLLGHNNIVDILVAISAEKPVVFCSDSSVLLVAVAESFLALLYPFYWQGVYMPLLPRKLLDYLYAPVPFIAGVRRAFLDDFDLPRELMFVDIDKDQVTVPTLDFVPQLPERDRSKLLKRLEEAARVDPVKGPALHTTADLSFPNGEDMRPISNYASTGGIQLATTADNKAVESKKQHKKHSKYDEEEIRQSFLRLWTKLLLRYRAYLKKPVADPNQPDAAPGPVQPSEPFNTAAFISDSDPEARSFLTSLTETQMFSFFINERWTPDGKSTEADLPDVRLFDESIVAKQNRSAKHQFLGGTHNTPFLDDTSRNVSTTIIAARANTSGLQAARYQYDYFPALKDSLFGPVYYTEPLIHESTFQRKQMTDMMDKASQVLMVSSSTARRDWQQTLVAVVLIQCVWRGFSQRKVYREMLRDKAEEQLRVRVEACTVLQAHLRSMLTRKKLRDMGAAASVLQGVMRTTLAVRKVYEHRYALQVSAIKTLQAALRAKLATRRLKRKCEASIVLQAALRAKQGMSLSEERILASRWLVRHLLRKQQRAVFLSKIQKVRTVQAVVRGMIARRTMKASLKEKLARVRVQMVQLWHEQHVSRVYRATFWMVFSSVSFMHLAVHEEEVVRLHAAKQRFSEKEKKSREALAVETEKLYHLLKFSATDSIRESLFREMNIPVKSKKRKRVLVDALWAAAGSHEADQASAGQKRSLEDRSAEVILAISSTVSHANEEHKKGSASRGGSPVPSELGLGFDLGDPSTLVQLRKQQRIQKNLLFTVKATMQSLMQSRVRQDELEEELTTEQFVSSELKRRVFLLGDGPTERSSVNTSAQRGHPAIVVSRDTRKAHNSNAGHSASIFTRIHSAPHPSS